MWFESWNAQGLLIAVSEKSLRRQMCTSVNQLFACWWWIKDAIYSSQHTILHFARPNIFSPDELWAITRLKYPWSPFTSSALLACAENVRRFTHHTSSCSPISNIITVLHFHKSCCSSKLAGTVCVGHHRNRVGVSYYSDCDNVPHIPFQPILSYSALSCRLTNKMWVVSSSLSPDFIFLNR